jgi:hypothetical protein
VFGGDQIKYYFSSFLSRIYIVHDEVKDKAFELELSWVGECKLFLDINFSSALHLIYYWVPFLI